MDEYEALAKNIDNEEVRAALFQMGPLKAPGIDSVHAFFFQKHWSVVRESICDLVRKIFDGGFVDSDICRTLIVLIHERQSW